MSESSFPFQGGTAVAERPLAEVPTDEVAPEGNRSRVLLLAGGACVLVLAVVAYFLFFAGGGSDDTTAGAVAPNAGKVLPSVAPSPAAPVVAKQRINAKSFGRDPFKPLFVEDTTSAGSVTTGSTGSTTTSAGSTPATSAPTVATPPVGTTTPVVTADHTFRVVGVSSDQTHITVRVDGKSYAGLKAGDVFATYFKVVVIGGKVNGFQFGDEKFSVFGTKKLSIAA
jgi:hypothetical protein